MVYREHAQTALQATLQTALQDRSNWGWLAQLLHSASRALDSLAAYLTHHVQEGDAPELTLEFHAEAGAPEGALYVNGQLVGQLAGVTRL
jgi:hypothetical protein